MKKLITKLTLLVGAFLLLGIGNAKAQSKSATFYYDASVYNSQNPNKPITGIKVQLYSWNNIQLNPATSEMTLIEGTNTYEWKSTYNGGSGNYVYLGTILFIPYFNNNSTTSNTVIINNGNNASSSQLGSSSGGNFTTTRANYLSEGIYSYNTTASRLSSQGANGTYSNKISTVLSWSNSQYGDNLTDSYTVTLGTSACQFSVESTVSLRGGYQSNCFVNFKVNGEAASDNDDYTITQEYESNQNITFNKVGTYTISGSLRDDATLIGSLPTLTVNVVPLAVNVGKITDLAWNPKLAQGTWSTNYGSNPFEGLINYTRTESNEDYEFELNVNIEPTFTTVEQPTQWSESTGMDSWIWNQMVAVKNTNDIDGYYYTNDDLTTAISDFTNTNSNMSADVENYFFPCSGTYKMTVTATGTDADKVFVNNGEQVINVYPSADLIYSYTLNGNPYNEGLNVSGYTVVAGKMVIADDLTSYDDLILYIPGVYLVTVDYTWNADSDVAVAASTTTTSGGNIDLTGVNETQKELVLSLTKNGATTPASEVTKILVSTGSNDTTGVEVIGEEDGEAVYYNLQGIKVQNPQHGIYVKVINGKATKVVL